MRDNSSGICDIDDNDKFAARDVDESRSFEQRGRVDEASRSRPGSKVTAFETLTLVNLKRLVEGTMNAPW